jgi:hypothetical protein
MDNSNDNLKNHHSLIEQVEQRARSRMLDHIEKNRTNWLNSRIENNRSQLNPNPNATEPKSLYFDNLSRDVALHMADKKARDHLDHISRAIDNMKAHGKIRETRKRDFGLGE